MSTLGEEDIRIRQIFYSQQVLDKLETKHQLEQWEVDEAFVENPAIEAVWQNHPRHGHRLVASSRSHDGALLLIALTPISVEDGIWNCITCHPVEEDAGHD